MYLETVFQQVVLAWYYQCGFQGFILVSGTQVMAVQSP